MEYVLERLRTRQRNETEDTPKERKRSRFEKEAKALKKTARHYKWHLIAITRCCKCSITYANIQSHLISYSLDHQVWCYYSRQSLLGSRSLYLAGRKHKPRRIIKDDTCMWLTQQVDLTSAIRAALFTHPAKFSEILLFGHVTGISHTGDPRILLPHRDPSFSLDLLFYLYSSLVKKNWIKKLLVCLICLWITVNKLSYDSSSVSCHKITSWQSSLAFGTRCSCCADIWLYICQTLLTHVIDKTIELQRGWY